MPGFDGLAKQLRPRRAKKKAKAADVSAAPSAPAPARQKIGLRAKGKGAAGHGVVTELRAGGQYGEGDDGHVHLEIRHGEIPKKRDGSRDHSKPQPATTRLTVPKHMAHGLSIGKKVRIHVEPCD